MKKLIFIFENFFDKRDLERFGVQFFIDNKVDVEVWDITEFSNKNFHQLIKPADEVKDNYVKRFKTSHDIKNGFKDLKGECLFAAYIGLNIRNLLIFKLLSKNKINYFTYSANSLNLKPHYGVKNFTMKIKSFFEKDLSSKIETFQNFLLRIFTPKLFGISNIPIYFKDNKLSEKSIDLKKKIVGKKTKIVLSHQRDYDLYLKYKNKNNEDEKYRSGAVLLDQNVGFHNDLIRIGEFMDPEKWYKSLKVFFDFLKNEYSITTTISAHPRSAGQINNFISGYPIIKNKTPQLVKNCSFVICQSTTAINFAVLFKKPMIFIYNHIPMKNRNSNIDQAQEVEFVASLFNKKPINIENLNNFNLENELKIDENSYNKFILEYIKSGGPDKTMPQIIMELL